MKEETLSKLYTNVLMMALGELFEGNRAYCYVRTGTIRYRHVKLRLVLHVDQIAGAHI
jgi:hypothetical protein